MVRDKKKQNPLFEGQKDIKKLQITCSKYKIEIICADNLKREWVYEDLKEIFQKIRRECFRTKKQIVLKETN